MFASSLASAIILRKRAPLRGGSDTCYLGKAAGGENWRPQGYSLLIFCLTHTVTHTGKRADGNNGVNRSRPHPFWRKKHRKALHGKGWKAFKHLVRMRSAVRIRPAAPENNLFLREWAVFLCVLQLLGAIKNCGLFLTTALPTDRKKPDSGIVCSGGRDSFVSLPFC